MLPRVDRASLRHGNDRIADREMVQHLPCVSDSFGGMGEKLG